MSADAEKTALIEKYLERDPYKPGRAEAVVKGRRLHVWALIGHLEAVDGSIEEVAKDYRIPVEAVKAAVAYYEENKCFIDDRLEQNRAD